MAAAAATTNTRSLHSAFTSSANDATNIGSDGDGDGDEASEAASSEAAAQGASAIQWYQQQHRKSSCCGCHRRMCHRRMRRMSRRSSTHVRFLPLIQNPNVKLLPAQCTWLEAQCLPLLEDCAYRASFNKLRLGRFRRLLIFFGVFVSALILMEKISFVQAVPDLVLGFFIFTVTMSMLNNYFTAVMTDLRYLERAVMYMRASVYLQSMLNTYLNCTQRYAAFSTPCDGFRTFVRDVENMRVLIMQSETSVLTAAGKDTRKAGDEMVAQRQEWANIMNRMTEGEAKAMGEARHTIGKRRVYAAPMSSFVPPAGGGASSGLDILARASSMLMHNRAASKAAAAAGGGGRGGAMT